MSVKISVFAICGEAIIYLLYNLHDSTFKKNQQIKGLFILLLKAFRSQIKGKHSLGREFQSPAMREKKRLT